MRLVGDICETDRADNGKGDIRRGFVRIFLEIVVIFSYLTLPADYANVHREAGYAIYTPAIKEVVCTRFDFHYWLNAPPNFAYLFSHLFRILCQKFDFI